MQSAPEHPQQSPPQDLRRPPSSAKAFHPSSFPSVPTAQDLLDEASGHVAMGELAEAAALYRQATELEPDNFDAWHSLGMALMRDDQLQAALGPALMATDLRPNDLLAWTALSQLHVKMGHIAEAETAKANARILSLGGKIAR
jgi:Flp pilus assembly protein TadD